MKKVEIESGSLIIYVDAEDIEMLLRIQKFGANVPESLFEEESIKTNQKDELGRYRIADTNNVQFIKSVPYIAHKNFLEKKSTKELRADIKSGKQVAEILKDLLRRHTFHPYPFSDEETNFMGSIGCIDQNMVTELVQLDYSDIIEHAKGSNYGLCLMSQMSHYIGNYKAEVKERTDAIEREKIEKSKVKRLTRKLTSPFKRGDK